MTTKQYIRSAMIQQAIELYIIENYFAKTLTDGDTIDLKTLSTKIGYPVRHIRSLRKVRNDFYYFNKNYITVNCIKDALHEQAKTCITRLIDRDNIYTSHLALKSPD